MTKRIGYIGVDVLNNATICNEAVGLIDAGVPLEVVSVYRFEDATFYHEQSLAPLTASLAHLYPISPVRLLLDLMRAPFVFGFRFFKAALRAIFCQAEGIRQRVRLFAHFFPAVVLAMRWRSRGIGHIHSHWAHTATTIAMHASEMLGVGFSFTAHANDIFVHFVGLTGKIRRARFVVSISEFHRQLYLQRGGEAKRLPVVYCGIDLHRFEAPTQPEPMGRKLIASVGRLVEKKGYHDLISACKLLRDRGVEFRCSLAGSGPLEESLRAQVQAQGLSDSVEITGKAIKQEDLPRFLRSAWLFALPCVRDAEGDMDGLPQVLIESMACGVPVVSTRLVGIPDLVRHQENGLLVMPGDIPSLADNLQRLLEDPALRARLGNSGEGWVKAHFGRQETVARLAELFQWAASTPGNSPPPMVPTSACGASKYYGPSENGLPALIDEV